MKQNFIIISTFILLLVTQSQYLFAQTVYHCQLENRPCIKLTDTGIDIGGDSVCLVTDTTCLEYHVDLTSTAPDLCIEEQSSDLLYEIAPLNETHVYCDIHTVHVYNIIAANFAVNQECNVTVAVTKDLATGNCTIGSSPTECPLRVALQRAEETAGLCSFFQINLLAGLTYQFDLGAYPLTLTNRVLLITNWVAGQGSYPHPKVNGASNADNFIQATLVSSSLTIRGLFIENFSAGNAGSGLSVISIDSNIDIIDTSFNSNKAQNQNGGAMYIEANSGSTSIQIIDSEFTSNSVLADDETDYGGAISIIATGAIDPGSALLVSNSIFTSNSGQGGGGAIHVKNFPQITVQNSQFVSNKVVDATNPNDHGGALLVETTLASTSLDIFDSTFTGNSAGMFGGDLYFTSTPASSVIIQRTTFTASSSQEDGGSIYLIGASSTLQIADSTFDQCTATSQGGAIYIVASNNLLVSDTTFRDNTVNVHGGALYVDNTDMQISMSSFYDNSAGSGGGAIMLDNNIIAQVETSIFSRNSAGINGGGIFYTDDTLKSLSLTFVSTTFNSNSASNGGAMRVFCDNLILTINNSTVSNNLAGNNGGGFHLFTPRGNSVTVADSFFTGNSAFDYAGAFAYMGPFTGSSTMTVSNTVFESNTAGNEGAAYYMNKVSSQTATVAFTSTTFRTNSGGSGTGITALSGTSSVITCQSCSFLTNTANNGEGSAIAVNGFATFNLFESTVANNLGYATVTYDNGAGTSVVSVRDTLFLNNVNNAADNGGGAFDVVGSSNSIEITRCIFQDNRNTGELGYGAGVRILTSNGAVVIQDSTFQRNSADGFGGAVMIRNNENMNVQITRTIFEDNSSGDLGGALYLANTGSTVTLSGNQFRRNIAPNIVNGFGGGMHIQGFSSLVVQDSTYDQNSAQMDGGAWRIGAGDNDSGNVQIVNTTVTGNRGRNGGGGFFLRFATLDITSSVFRSNTAILSGGGIFTTDVETSVLDSVVVDENRCSSSGCGVYNSGLGTGALSISSSLITSNAGGINGGGIFSLNHGAGSIISSTISGNAAVSSPTSGTERGGGLFLTGSSSTSITNSVVRSNTAGSTAGGVFINSGHTTSMSNTLLDSNAAGLRGGAVYVNLAGIWNVNNANFTSNTGTQGYHYFVTNTGVLSFSGYVCYNPTAAPGCRGPSQGIGVACSNALCPF